MHIPKNFFHDRYVLILLALNSVLVLYVALFIMLKVDPAAGTTHIVQYRANLGIDKYKSGSIDEVRIMSVFAAVQYVFGWILSMRLYAHRRYLSLTVLALAFLVLVLTLVVSNSLVLVS